MRTALAVICALTLSATAYLSASLFILRSPRANYQMWFLVGSLFATQGVLTLIALRRAGRTLRYAALAGAGANIWVGASWAHGTLTRAHFEGYALVLGSALVLQGALTLWCFAPWQFNDQRRPSDSRAAPARS